MGEEVREITASLGFERAQDLVGRSDLLVQARHLEGGRRRADQADRRDARPRAARPAAARRRPRGGRPDRGPADPDEGQGCLRQARRACGQHRARQGDRGGVGRGRRRARRRRRPRARHGARRRDRAHADLQGRPRGQRRHARPAPLQRLGRRPGPRRLQRLRRGHHRGGGAGRRGQDHAGRQGRDHEGQEPLREAGQRLGRQVVRLRRPARAAVRAGRRRLPPSASACRGPTL